MHGILMEQCVTVKKIDTSITLPKGATSTRFKDNEKR